MSYSEGYDSKATAMISETGINNLCVAVNSYALKIKKSLDDISDLIEDSSSYFEGDTKDDFVERLDDIMGKKTRIKDNILSYVDDYNTVVSKFKNMDVSITFNKIKIEDGGK